MENRIKRSGSLLMVTTHVFEGHTILGFSEKAFARISGNLSIASSVLDFFPRDLADRFIDAHRHTEGEGCDATLVYPFSGEHCGSVGDAIIYKDDAGNLQVLSVSVRGRVRISEGGGAYGGGCIFLLQNPNKARLS